MKMKNSYLFFVNLAFFILLISCPPIFGHPGHDAPKPDTPKTTTPCHCPPTSDAPPTVPPASNAPPTANPPPMTNAPPTTNNVPPTKSNVPPTTNNVPPTNGNVPPTNNNVPPNNNNAPPTPNKPPNTNVPPTTTNAPPANNNVPPTPNKPPTANVPPTTNVPPTSNVPPPTTNIPPTTTNAPPTTNVPPATNIPRKAKVPNMSFQGNFQGNLSFNGKFTKIYAFGDSYTDNGNAQLIGGLRSFVGALLSGFTQNSNFQPEGKRLCNGRLLIDFLCERLQLPYLKPYKNLGDKPDDSTGINFAIAGSSSLDTNFFLNHRFGQSLWWKPTPESVQTQIRWFNKFLLKCILFGPLVCKAELAKSLFFIGAVGLSDYVRIFGSFLATHFPISSQFLSERSAEHVCQLLKVMLDNGAKYIVVQGLPPIGCLPLDLTKSQSDRDGIGCNTRANQLIKAHNILLENKIQEYRKTYTSSTIIFADFWKAYETILTNYKQYQFEEPFKACCGAGVGDFNFNVQQLCGTAGTTTCKDPSKYIVWDGVHLTEAMNKKMSDLLFKQEGFCRPSFSNLAKM